VGLLAGLEVRGSAGRPAGEAAVAAVTALLRRGFLALPEGARGEVIGLTPPLTIPERGLREALAALADVLGAQRDQPRAAGAAAFAVGEQL